MQCPWKVIDTSLLFPPEPSLIIGSYFPETFAHYFITLTNLFGSLDFPICIEFNPAYHPFAVDHKQNQWFLYEGRHLDEERAYSGNEIGALILEVSRGIGNRVFATRIFISPSAKPYQVQQFQAGLVALNADPNWISIHQITEENAFNAHFLFNDTVFLLAAQFGDLKALHGGSVAFFSKTVNAKPIELEQRLASYTCM